MELLVWDTSQAKSRDYAAYKAMPAVLAACDAFQDLIDGKSGAEAEAYVQVGYESDPWTTEATIADLENQLCRVWILPHRETPSASYLTASVGACPASENVAIMRLRRQVRGADVGINSSGLAGVLNVIADRLALMRYEVVERAQEQSGPVADLMRCELVEWGDASADEQASQGTHVVADFTLHFGRPSET